MATKATAPGKVILCGEHAVVYGQPAIALPLQDVRATATIEDRPAGTGLAIQTPDIGEQGHGPAPTPHPFAALIGLTLAHLGRSTSVDIAVTLRSAIPIASGMGSGAALGAALVKALAHHFGAGIAPAEVSRLVYESERVFHGTPSGIDNTVVSYGQAIWFMRGRTDEAAPTFEPLVIKEPFTLLIADTGVRAPTHLSVGRVREQWLQAPEHFNRYFADIGALAAEVRALLATGNAQRLGAALDRNQVLLRQLGVSSPELERLIAAARATGAFGAKLSGAGAGGIMLALVDTASCAAVARALQEAGAQRIVQTTVGQHNVLF